jgi:hypothetical protein
MVLGLWVGLIYDVCGMWWMMMELLACWLCVTALLTVWQ